MLFKNRCIVLSKLKYKDYDLIVKCYTKKRGVVTYLLKGVLKGKQKQSKIVYFQELSQIQIEERFNPNQSLQYIKEVKLSYIYQSLHTNIYKSSVVLFLSEILSNVFKEEERNSALFEYLETSLQYFDIQEHFSNFHLLFLLKLTRYLGFYPDDSNMQYTFFNLQSGIFENRSHNFYSISGENLTLLKAFLGIDFDALNSLKINARQRQQFLKLLLQYFELHLAGFKQPKSLQILNDVFH